MGVSGQGLLIRFGSNWIRLALDWLGIVCVHDLACSEVGLGLGIPLGTALVKWAGT
jgi:hypothetical protein